MKLRKLFLLLTFLPFAAAAQYESSTVTKIGDAIPQFSFETQKGSTVNISDYNGKLILINLFATWCPPCNIELPLVQKRIWEKYQNNPGFALFVFGREEGWEKLTPFKASKAFTFPILPDVKKEVFSKFATQYIPRNILVDQSGKIIYQSVGYDEKDFSKLVNLIDEKMKPSVKAR